MEGKIMGTVTRISEYLNEQITKKIKGELCRITGRMKFEITNDLIILDLFNGNRGVEVNFLKWLREENIIGDDVCLPEDVSVGELINIASNTQQDCVA